ncbi:MAG: filamentous hemagglutinin N-terminal domain-containing protein, partial [Candidatus Omnitrophica bacterium]|nr:filamentous hemagglutinin N-terminal domain-containing protein [Candidatus Omnitrophota bacterium]
MRNKRVRFYVILCVAVIFVAFNGIIFAEEGNGALSPNELPVISDAGGAQVNIDQAANLMTITSASTTSVMSFLSFNVGSNASVNIMLPSADSRMLNKVVGNSPSNIFGGINCDKGLWVFVNTNGIYFAPSAKVNVDNMVVSTLDISTNNFVNGNYVFQHREGSTYAQVLNEGRIEGNNIGLMGSAVQNTGIILAKAGAVHLASGDKTTVSFDRRGLIGVEINENTSGEVVDMQGEKVKDAVANSGKIEGVQVAMTVKTARNIFKNAVNQTGMVKATGIVEEGGVIKIVANNNVNISGTLESISQAPAEKKAAIIIQSQDFIGVSSEFISIGNTKIEAAQGITVDADVITYSGNLDFIADSDLDGVGAFKQEKVTTIATVEYGDITIQASGESALANVNSAGDLVLRQGGAPAIFNQWIDSQIITKGSLLINPGVTLNANNTVYEIGKDWVNLGNFNPQFSRVLLVSAQDALVRGSNIFYDFSITEPGKIVRFDSQNTQVIVGNLTFRGEYGRLLTLTSIDPAKQWSINPQGQTDIQYSLIFNLNNIRGPPLKAIHSSSLGNNFNLDLDPYWTGQGLSSFWSDPNNWDSGTVPTVFDIVTFDGTTGINPNKDSYLDESFGGTIAKLTIDGYTGKITLIRDLTVKGDITINSGTLDAGSNTITVGGNWTHGNGDFLTGTSNVVFYDASRSSIISGNNTFYNFSCITSNKNLYFEAGKTQTIMNTLYLAGRENTHGSLDKILLRSTQEGTRWYIDPQGAFEVSYVNVYDSYNLNSRLIVGDGIDHDGNSYNWDASRTASVTGNWNVIATWGGSSVPIAGDTVTINSGVTVTVTADAACTSILISDGGSLIVGGFTITVSSTATVGQGTSGNLTINNAAGTKTFAGLVTINAGATWNNSGNSTCTFQGGITNSGTFTAGSGVQTFNTNAQALTGTFSIPSVTVTGVTLANNDALTVATALTGTGGLTNTATGTLNIGGTSTITTITATAVGNTVNFNAAGNQTACKVTTYNNLTLSGTSVKTFATTPTVNGILSMEGTATVVVTTGVVTYGASAT